LVRRFHINIKRWVSRPEECTLLGFCFERGAKGWEIRIAPKSLKRIKEKIRGKTKRNDPSGAEDKIKKLETVISGWVNYFKIAVAKAKNAMKGLDEFTRTRVRIVIWKQWKHPKTRVANLKKLGIKGHRAYEWGKSRKGACRIAHSQVLHYALNNDWFTKQRYTGFAKQYYWKTEHQTKVILINRRIPDRYVRWCERTGSQLIATFLLDTSDGLSPS